MKRNEARKLVESLVNLRNDATDKIASASVQAYPTLKGNGALIKAGTRINWEGQIKKSSVDLWDLEQNNPDKAPTLWVDLNYKDGIRIIPTTITSTDMFMKDELGYWNNVLYKSLIDNNVWTPEAYPQGWEMVV